MGPLLPRDLEQTHPPEPRERWRRPPAPGQSCGRAADGMGLSLASPDPGSASMHSPATPHHGEGRAVVKAKPCKPTPKAGGINKCPDLGALQSESPQPGLRLPSRAASTLLLEKCIPNAEQTAKAGTTLFPLCRLTSFWWNLISGRNGLIINAQQLRGLSGVPPPSPPRC